MADLIIIHTGKRNMERKLPVKSLNFKLSMGEEQLTLTRIYALGIIQRMTNFFQMLLKLQNKAQYLC